MLLLYYDDEHGPDEAGYTLKRLHDMAKLCQNHDRYVTSPTQVHVRVALQKACPESTRGSGMARFSVLGIVAGPSFRLAATSLPWRS